MIPPRPRPAHQTQAQVPRTLDRQAEHALENQLAVILGYCELLLDEAPATDERRQGLIEIERAAKTALNLLRDPGDP